MKKQKVIIDTDPGKDDALALMLACASPELEMLGVTTVCGNTTIENTTRNARFVLDAMNRSDIPVYSGAAKPLKRELIRAVSHGEDGLEGVRVPSGKTRLTGDAAEQILRLIRENPGEVTLIALAPLTNIALAIQKDPAVMKQVKEIIVMGGAIAVPGNKNRVAEYNIFADPEAADIVMNFPVSKVMVPLDVCNDALMNIDELKQLQNRRLRSLTTALLRPYISRLRKVDGAPAAVLYDPLVVYYALCPGRFETCRMNIQVETKGAITRGMTVADRRKVTDGTPLNITVAQAVSIPELKRCLVEALNRYRT